MPSRTIANCFSVPTSAWETWPKALVPWSFSDSWTCQSIDCWSWPASALVELGALDDGHGEEVLHALVVAGDQRLVRVVLAAASASGQVALLYFSTHAGLGLCRPRERVVDRRTRRLVGLGGGGRLGGGAGCGAGRLGRGGLLAWSFLSALGLSRPWGRRGSAWSRRAGCRRCGVAAAQGPGFWRAARHQAEPQLRLALDDVHEALVGVSPGISTTMFVLPWVVTSASATPEPLTRLLMIFAASLSWLCGTLSSAARSVIRCPPWRSSPREGFHCAGERDQSEEDHHAQAEDGQGASRTGRLACHGLQLLVRAGRVGVRRGGGLLGGCFVDLVRRRPRHAPRRRRCRPPTGAPR